MTDIEPLTSDQQQQSYLEAPDELEVELAGVTESTALLPPPYSAVEGGPDGVPRPPKAAGGSSAEKFVEMVEFHPTLQEEQHGIRTRPISQQPRKVTSHLNNPQFGFKPDNFMAFSLCNMITSCLCCSWVTLMLSIIPVVFSNAVDAAWNRGDGRRARFHSRCALGWNIVVLLCFLAILLFSIYWAYMYNKALMEAQEKYYSHQQHLGLQY